MLTNERLQGLLEKARAEYPTNRVTLVEGIPDQTVLLAQLAYEAGVDDTRKEAS